MDTLLPNGCYEDSGYDFFEQEVREEFELYARRIGYHLKRQEQYNFFYENVNTEDAWRMYHVAHVRGRDFQIKRDADA